jgi:hypothetical protein
MNWSSCPVHGTLLAFALPAPMGPRSARVFGTPSTWGGNVRDRAQIDTQLDLVRKGNGDVEYVTLDLSFWRWENGSVCGECLNASLFLSF